MEKGNDNRVNALNPKANDVHDSITKGGIFNFSHKVLDGE
jgi:hypothetical protein